MAVPDEQLFFAGIVSHRHAPRLNATTLQHTAIYRAKSAGAIEREGSELRKGLKQQSKKLSADMKDWFEDKMEKVTEAGEKFRMKAPAEPAGN